MKTKNYLKKLGLVLLLVVVFTQIVNAQALKTISGPTQVCNGTQNVTYSFPTSGVPNTTFSWALSSGITGTSVSNNITVNFDSTNFSGSIAVSESIGNLVVAYGSLNITIVQTPNLGTISGGTTVCPGQSTNVIYSVPSRADVKGYIWSVPSGATIEGVLNQPYKISVKYGRTAISGNVSVMASCGSGGGTVSTLAITVNPLPLNPGTISGKAAVCLGENNVVYSVPLIANATNYFWQLPSGATGNSATNSISVNYGSTAVSGSISVNGINSCGWGESSSLAITVGTPSNAGTITGTTAVCVGQNKVVYNIPAIANTTSYQWTLPNGATGSSTTNSISVNYGANAVSGNITVKGVNTCSTGLESTLPITINPLPSNTGSITGTSTVCPGQNSVVYSVPAIANATSYEWTLPSGTTGTSTTNSISVNYGLTAVSGNITVRAKNNCGVGSTSSPIAITVNPLPSSAGAITGLSTLCQSQNAVVYSVPVISNATSYQWTLPTGATGTSTTNSITVDYGLSAQSGYITVKGMNSCGDGTSSTLFINVNNTTPSSPGAISGPASVCLGEKYFYIVPVSLDATSYEWTLPSGATGSSTTNSISVNYGANAVSGNITVKGVNACGIGLLSSTIAISVNNAPPSSGGSISGERIVCVGQNNVGYFCVPLILNATSYEWTLPSGATGTSTTNSISVNYGANAVSGNITVKGVNACGTGLLSSTIAISVFNAPPSSPGVISGAAYVCLGQNAVVYSIPAIANATSYQWTLPSGATGTSTTNSITVDYGLSAVSGNIFVKGINSCGIGVASTLAIITMVLPSNAGAITGITTVCQGQNTVIYSVPTIAFTNSYQWTLPSGATGISTINYISVNYSINAVSGNITVKGVNTCGTGLASTLAITINPLPSNAGAITGITTVCAGQNTVVYSVPAIANATYYQWTLPSGATGTSTTNSITVDYGLSAVSGNISVKGVNSCGAGVASVFAVNVVNCSLPSNNFKLEVTDPTCQTKANGKLKITATASYNYTATMDGVNYTFTNNVLDIANLAPKTYAICIKVPALNNYTQCFEFTVKSAPGLTGKTRMDTKGNKTTANVIIESGTAPYTVEINGKTIEVTFENQLNIPVQNGDLLEIKTSVACEGKIRERVSLSNELMAYPNPTAAFVELFIPTTFQKKYVMIQMLDNAGKSVVNREFKVIDNSIIIPMENLSEGLYIINVQLETLQTIKIIKK